VARLGGMIGRAEALLVAQPAIGSLVSSSRTSSTCPLSAASIRNTVTVHLILEYGHGAFNFSRNTVTVHLILEYGHGAFNFSRFRKAIKCTVTEIGKFNALSPKLCHRN